MLPAQDIWLLFFALEDNIVHTFCAHVGLNYDTNPYIVWKQLYSVLSGITMVLHIIPDVWSGDAGTDDGLTGFSVRDNTSCFTGLQGCLQYQHRFCNSMQLAEVKTI
jgi:hypothetical protein